MSFQTLFMIFIVAVVIFMGVMCPFFLFVKGPKGDEGPAVS